MKSPPTTNISIIGIGAMGCLLGARLSLYANVSLIGNWKKQLKAIQQNDLKLIDPDGRISTHSIHVTNNLDDIPLADIVLIMVKSHQTKRAAQQAQPILAPNGIVLTLQNGIGNLATITAVIPKKQVALGITSEGATIVAPGTVRHAGWGQTYLAGNKDTAVAIEQISSLFNQAQFKTEISDNVDALVWGKLAINAGINPLTALLRVPNGFLAENKAARQIMETAANEVAQVAQALTIDLPFPDAGQRAFEVAQATAANHSSMLQDVQRGAATEIDVICGAVVKYGRKLNVPTPVNALLLAKIKEIGDYQPSAERLEIDIEAILSNLRIS